MAYQLVLDKPAPKDAIVLLDSMRAYFEFDFSGFAATDIIKVEWSTDGGSTWITGVSKTTLGASGIMKLVSGLIKPTVNLIRIKGYDSDGATALTAAEIEYKSLMSTSAIPHLKSGDDIGNDIDTLAKSVQDISSDVALGNRSEKKTMYLDAMNSAYTDIEANDTSDMTKTLLTPSTTEATYGIDKYHPGMREGIKRGKWVINGTEMSVPHWIAGKNIYTFSSAVVAKRCKEVLVLKGARYLVERERTNYDSSTTEYNDLTGAMSALNANIIAKIADI